MSDEELRELYSRNKDFHEYIDRCRRVGDVSVEEMLKLKTIQIYAEWVKTRQEDDHHDFGQSD